MLRRSHHFFSSSPEKRQHSKLIIWGTFGQVPARRLKPTELVITNLPPQSEFKSSWNFVACNAGSRHISLLTEEGHLVLIGSNKHGQLGRDTAQHTPENEPQFFDLDFQNPEKEKPNALACGCNYTIAYRRAAGGTTATTTKTSGKNEEQKESEDIRAIVVGYNHAGQLGLGHKEILDNRDGTAEWRPNASWWRQGLPSSSSNDENQKNEIAHIDCGYNHTFAIMTDGRVFSFGTNQWGELGLGRSVTDSPMTPKILPFFDPLHEREDHHQNDREMQEAMHNMSDASKERLRNHQKKMKRVKVADVRAGNAFSMFLSAEGRVYACGSGNKGQLPFATQEPTVYPIQRDARPVLMRVSNISCGCDHIVIVTRTKNKEKEQELFERREKLLEIWKKKNSTIASSTTDEIDEIDEDEKFFGDLLNENENLYHDYEVFFRGSMPDIGIVNATGNFQKVELGSAQPPFQFVKSHASSTLLIDNNGDFYGLGANPEGQLGSWGDFGNPNNSTSSAVSGGDQQKDPVKREAEDEIKRNEAREENLRKYQAKQRKLMEQYRQKEIEIFGKEVVEEFENEKLELEAKNKFIKEEAEEGEKIVNEDGTVSSSSSSSKKAVEEGELKTPEGFGIVYNNDLPSAFDLHSTRFQSKEMPLLAVVELREVTGLRVRKNNNKNNKGDESTENTDSDELLKIENEHHHSSKTVRFDSKCVVGGGKSNNLPVLEWRDRVGIGNGFGVLLDPKNEYFCGLDDDDEDDDGEDDQEVQAEEKNICYMPPLAKSNKKKRNAELSKALLGGGKKKKKNKKRKLHEDLLSGKNRQYW